MDHVEQEDNNEGQGDSLIYSEVNEDYHHYHQWGTSDAHDVIRVHQERRVCHLNVIRYKYYFIWFHTTINIIIFNRCI